MSSAELDDIVASMEGALRRAYALGRQDAIDQLTRYLQSDDVVSQRLALAAPVNNPPPTDEPPVNEAEPAPPAADDRQSVEMAEEEGRDSKPVLPPSGPVRPIIPNRPARGGLVESIRDFVYPSRID